MTRVGYGRVSTEDQSLESQELMLAEAGCEKQFTDKWSGRNATRPGLAAMLEYLRPGDTLVIVRLSRLGRSLSDLLSLLKQLDEKGVQLVSLTEALDTSTPTGRLMFNIVGAFNQFEAEVRSDNTREGLAAARKRGAVGGRRRKLTTQQARLARSMMRSENFGANWVAHSLGVSRQTVWRAIRKLEKEEKQGTDDSTDSK